MKQYHLLSGLFRSGNTVLAAIMNQHPQVYVSPLSPLSSLLWNNQVESENNQNIRRNSQQYERYERIQSSIVDVMYLDVEKPIVFDREKDWGHPANLNLAIQYVSKRPKIVTTVRTITDIIASYVTIDNGSEFDEASRLGSFGTHYKDRVDVICENLMRPNGRIERNLLSIHNSLNDDRCDVHLVEYDDLISNPQSVMDGIYSFLEIETYSHNFNNIKKVEVDIDDANGHSPDLHVVRKKLGRSKVRAEDVLPEHIMRKYSGLEFWRK